ncbi:hypothetical protein NEAUS07_2544 [Nematocida ausubeli]|nr:hypothetical protein NEAUS07_2544 [Nematocida ausubeli]
MIFTLFLFFLCSLLYSIESIILSLFFIFTPLSLYFFLFLYFSFCSLCACLYSSFVTPLVFILFTLSHLSILYLPPTLSSLSLFLSFSLSLPFHSLLLSSSLLSPLPCLLIRPLPARHTVYATLSGCLFLLFVTSSVPWNIN